MAESDVAAVPAEARNLNGRNSLLYLVGALVQGMGIFLLQPFALHLLNDDVKWQSLYLSVSVIQVGVVLATAGLPLAITNAWFEDDGERRSRAISGFLALGGVGVGLIGGAIVAVVNVVNHQPFTFALAVVAMGLQASVLAAQALLRAQGGALRFVVLSLISSMGAYAVGLLSMVVFGREPVIFMSGYLAGVVISAIISTVWTRPINPAKVPGVIGEAVRLAAPVLPHTGALMLLTQGAPFLLALTSAPGVSGDLGKVQIFLLGAITVLNALNNVWAPSIMGARGTERIARFKETLWQGALVSLALVILAGTAANAIVHIMAGGREDLIVVAQILPLAGVGYMLYLNSSNILFAEKTTWLMAVVTPVTLVLAVLLLFVPAKANNLVGVSAGVAVSFLVLGVLYSAVVFKRTKGAWPVGRLAVIAVASALFVFGMSLLPTDLTWGIVELILVVAICLAGLVTVLVRRRKAVSTSREDA